MTARSVRQRMAVRWPAGARKPGPQQGPSAEADRRAPGQGPRHALRPRRNAPRPDWEVPSQARRWRGRSPVAPAPRSPQSTTVSPFATVLSGITAAGRSASMRKGESITQSTNQRRGRRSSPWAPAPTSARRAVKFADVAFHVVFRCRQVGLTFPHCCRSGR